MSGATLPRTGYCPHFETGKDDEHAVVAGDCDSYTRMPAVPALLDERAGIWCSGGRRVAGRGGRRTVGVVIIVEIVVIRGVAV